MTLEDILSELGIEFKRPGEHHHAATRVAIDCPWCSAKSNRFRMGVMLDGRPASCWSCGFHNVVGTLCEASGKPWRFVKELLNGINAPRRAGNDAKQVAGKLELPAGVGPLLRAHRDYLRDRGFHPDDLVKLWNIGGIGPRGRLAWRVFIPIADAMGQVVSWTTRKIAPGDDAKYWTAKPSQEIINSKRLLYGEGYCRHTIVVHEGPLDVHATGPGAVGTLGKVVVQAQVARIAAYPKRMICFDSEPAAQARADKLCDDLAVYPGETIKIVLESGKDPAECLKTKSGRRELRRLREMLR